MNTKKNKIYKRKVARLKKYFTKTTPIYITLEEFIKFFDYFGKVIEEIGEEIDKMKNHDKEIENLKKVITREKRFSTLAKIEGKGAHKRAFREHGAAKKDSQWEEKIDNKFAKIRAKKVKIAKDKI